MFGWKSSSALSLGWDIHCHVIPEIDDGARTIDESIECITALQRIGYEGAVVTPHIYKDVHNNSRDQLVSAFEQLQAVVSKLGMRFGLRLAAEYFADEHLISLASSEPLLSFEDGNRRCVLVEFPYISEPLNWADVLSAVTRAGYHPVIAHPERYRYFAAEPEDWLRRLAPFSPSYQCEIGSFGGQYGERAHRVAKYLYKQHAVRFWGTDLHRPEHVQRFIVTGLRQLRSHRPINPISYRL